MLLGEAKRNSMRNASNVSLRKLITPLAVMALAMTMFVVLGLLWAASRIDRMALASQKVLVTNNLQLQQKRLQTQLRSELTWDEAVSNLVNKFDADWADANLATWYLEFNGTQQVAVFDTKDRPIYFAEHGVRSVPSKVAALGLDRMELLNVIRAKEIARGALLTPSSTFDTLVSKPVDLTKVVGLPNGPALVAVTLVQPDFGRVLPVEQRSSVVISIKPLDSMVVDEIAEVLSLSHARIEVGKRDDNERAVVAVNDASGLPVAWVTWVPDRPGMLLLKTAAPFIAIGLLGLLLLAVWMLERTRRLAQLLKIGEERALFLARHDPLTGLPNRLLLNERIDAALAETTGNRQRLALLCIDLDRFKDVNDTHGHYCGDQLLIELASRLAPLFPAGTTFARLGGDEFSALIPGVGSAAQIEVLCNCLLDAMSQRLKVKDTEHFLSGSIGIAVTDLDTVTREELMRRADVALYRAKAAGRACFVRHHIEMDGQLNDRRETAHDLRLALTQSQLIVHYQPQVRCSLGRVDGVEALLRWQHPKRGWMAPELLISIAEESGLIHELGMWVIERALIDGKSWPQLRLAINVSPEQFKRPGFADRVKRLSQQHAVTPERIELEITETLLLDPSAETMQNLQQLRDAGYKLVLDDFGTGYSSLGYLRRFRLDKLKIDRSFVQVSGEDHEAQAILRTIVGVAQSLGLECTAEGVETKEQLLALRALGCDSAQGFYYAPAVASNEIEALCGSALFMRG
jgi:diguanylate cyclase (GGDEF)-like protein